MVENLWLRNVLEIFEYKIWSLIDKLIQNGKPFQIIS